MSKPKGHTTDEVLSRFAADPELFRNNLVIDAGGEPRLFGEVIEPWQATDFRALDPGLMAAVGRKRKGKGKVYKRAYLERSRGHSKTQDAAMLSLWALAFAPRMIRAFAYAADKDQAGLLHDAMHSMVRLNPWLDQLIDIQKNLVLNKDTGAFLKIEASDHASAYGTTPDLVLVDELANWPDLESAQKLWNTIYSSVAKRPDCLMVVISNAGFEGSFQWALREAARTDDQWYFNRLEGPVASWITQESLEQQRKMLISAAAFRRLWLNQWCSSIGDAIDESLIDAAFRPGLKPMPKREKGYRFVAGVDLGIKRDNSAVVTVAVADGGIASKIRLADVKLWKPTPGRKVNLSEVEQYIRELDDRYKLEFVAFDSWNHEHLAQRLEVWHKKRRTDRLRFGAKPWMREVAPTSVNLRNIAFLTIESFNDSRLMLYEQPDLRRDLYRLRVEEKSYGFRLSSPRDGSGHGDAFSAFGVALLIAHEVAGQKVLKARFEDSNRTFAQDWAAFEQRADDYTKEMLRLAELPNDPAIENAVVRTHGALYN